MEILVPVEGWLMSKETLHRFVRPLMFHLVLCLLLLAGGAPAGARRLPQERPVPEEPQVPLHLRWGSFDPLAGEPGLPARLRRLTLGGDRLGLRLVQFPGPIQDEWYEAMERAGLSVVTYIPDYAYLVWGNGAAVENLRSLAPLRWAGLYHPAYALHPALADSATLPAEIEVIVQVYDHPDADTTVRAILGQALNVFRPPYSVLVYRNIGVRVSSDDLTWLASLPDVVNVEPYHRPRLLDEVQGQIIAGNLNGPGTQPSGPGYLAWLQGLGFATNPNDYPIVDVTDDGIDDGDATPIHPDFYVLGSTSNPDRLAYNYNWTTDPLADGGGGHGNINASIVAGYNNGTGFPYEDSSGYNYGLGINPFGRVAGSKVFNNAGEWDTNASNTQLINNSYALGARISSNSWGCGYPYIWCWGDYDTEAQEYDSLVRDARPGVTGNQEMVIVFAAGNDGEYGTGTVGTPGTAKNVITVGAAENYRPTWTDGCGVRPTGADSAQDIASFSSRGPCDDSRVKPDIVAPGTHIQGAASQSPNYNGSGVCDTYMPPGQTLYAASSGTSHSTPAVAGAASLVYYWYQTRYGGGQPPSPAMVKAYLIHTARYLTGNGAGGNLPSNSQGFGEVNLGMAFDSTPRIVLDQDHLFGSTGQTYRLDGVVADSGRPFRVTLAWTDAPGPTIGNAYVNNLDLAVTVGGQTYRGNVFSGPTSVTGGSADPRNNVESVFLPAGLSGPFTVVITATNIAGNGVPGNSDSTDQDFALVVYNAAIPGIALNPTAAGQTGLPGETVTYTLRITNTGELTDTFTVAIQGNSWPTSASPGAIGPLGPNSGADFWVRVAVPNNAMGDEQDVASVEVTSQQNTLRKAYSVLTTTTGRIYNLAIAPLATEAFGLPGRQVVHTLRITNTGNYTDTFSIGASDYRWPTSVPGTVGPLGPGAGAGFPVMVTIPPTVTAGSRDTATVRGTSQNDPGKSASGNVTTIVGQGVYLPLVLKGYPPYAAPCGVANNYCEDYDSPATAYGPLAFGQSYSAYPDDENDYYYFVLGGSASVTVHLSNYIAEGQLIVYDENNNMLGRDWDSSDGIKVGPLSLSPGKYFIRVYTSSTNPTALYTLVVVAE